MKPFPRPHAVAARRCLRHALFALALVACGARAPDAGHSDDTRTTWPGAGPRPADPDRPDDLPARPPAEAATGRAAPPVRPGDAGAAVDAHVDEDAPPPPRDPGDLPGLTGPPGNRVLVLLPMTGRSAPLGTALAAGLVAARGALGEPGPEFVIRDVADGTSASAALEELGRDNAFTGTVAVVDRAAASELAARGATTGRPVLLISAGDGAAELPGRVWRVFPTPALVVRTAAGAGLARGGRRAAVLRAQTPAAETFAGLFRAVWTAGGGSLEPTDLTYDPARPDWAKLAARLQSGEADTVFFPEGAVAAAQALATFASVGVWSASPTRNLERSRVRTLTFLGTPDWYSPDVMRQSGRYFEGALIPVAFATESVPGARLAARFSAAGRAAPNTVDGLLWESVLAIDAAGQSAVRHGTSALSSLPAIQSAQVTVGLQFDQPDALQRLYLLTVRDGRFAAAR